jgi:surface antigen/uncharacterized protein YlxW (UPF0749 family)
VRAKSVTFSRQRIRLVIATGALAALLIAAPFAAAANYTQQIKELQQQNSGNYAARGALTREAQTLEAQIATLQGEINVLQAQVNESEAKKHATEAAIVEAERQLNEQKAVLGANIKQKYLNNEMTTLEMLATSKSLSDYIDREQSLRTVQSKIEQTMAKIDALQKQLADDHAKIEKLLLDQTTMRDAAAAKKTEVDRLLALNEQERASYNATISSNNKQISALYRQQAIENNRYNIGSPTYGGTGGYPWANASYPSYDSDPWGMYKRECVSYTAWMVEATGRYMPYWGGRGNANEWDDNARAAGIPTDGNPREGDIAISNSGRYGHAMYVEAVHGDGTITVSQYNAGLDGRYSIATRYASGLVFIHF